MQQRQVLHIRTHDRPGEDRSWRLADGVNGQGVIARRWEMDSILTVSSGNKAGVCRGAAVFLCGSQGMLLLCLSAIFSIRRKDGCITVERERHWSRRMSHPPPLRESGAAVYAKTGGRRSCWEEASRSVGTEDRRKVSPPDPIPCGLEYHASQPLPRRKLNHRKFQQLPGLQMLLTWGSFGGRVPLSCHLVGGGAGDHLEPSYLDTCRELALPVGPRPWNKYCIWSSGYCSGGTWSPFQF